MAVKSCAERTVRVFLFLFWVFFVCVDSRTPFLMQRFCTLRYFLINATINSVFVAVPADLSFSMNAAIFDVTLVYLGARISISHIHICIFSSRGLHLFILSLLWLLIAPLKLTAVNPRLASYRNLEICWNHSQKMKCHGSSWRAIRSLFDRLIARLSFRL